MGKKVKSADELTHKDQVVKTCDQLKAEYGKWPGGLNTLAPLIVPILLMGAFSVAARAKWTSAIADFLTFPGTPIVALAVGSVLAVVRPFLYRRE